MKQVGKIIDKLEDALPELEEFQGTMSEKRDQLEKLKVIRFYTLPIQFKFYNVILNLFSGSLFLVNKIK